MGEVPDINPARPAEVVATVATADKNLARRAVSAAADAFAAWRATPAPIRGDILRRAADILEQRIGQIAEDFTREEGKTLDESTAETKRAIAILRYYSGCTLDADGETYPSHLTRTLLFARREPLGVVVAITPWNFPLAIPAWKLAPALAYGNTVVWKPADLVPLTSVHFTRALVDAGLPDGVLNLVLGRGVDIGDALVQHESVDAITFTGSNAVGHSLRLKAAEHGKKLQLEMGGKNAAVVLADANLAFAADQVARGAFLSAGQKCTATSRVIVEESVLPEFQERLVGLASSWKLGDPMERDTKVGPLASNDQMRSVLDYLRIGSEAGSQTVAGGGRATELGDGFFVRLTVLTRVDPRSRIAQEEIFGPVALLMPVHSFDHALALANDTSFGLTASLFTRDLRVVSRVVV